MTRATLFAPEVLQTSSIDCGPAALKSVVEGFGVPVHFERLREACRTGADGTSIDSLEDLACGLGFEAFQEVAPLSDAVEILARRAPCIVVVRGAGGAPHFVVLWRILGAYAEIMDPASGRRFVHRDELRRELYSHEQTLGEEEFARFWMDTGWREHVDARLSRLGIAKGGWHRTGREIVALDAAARFVERLARRRVAPRRRLASLVDVVLRARAENDAFLPPDMVGATFDDRRGVRMRGAVFLVIRRATGAGAGRVEARYRGVLGATAKTAREVLAEHLGGRARTLAVAAATTALLVVLLSLVEMLLLRAAFDAHTVLALPGQRFTAVGIYAFVVALLLGLETTLGAAIAKLGRGLELGVRVSLLQKLRRLPDAYFRTRPTSDVAHRSHGLFSVRALPQTMLDVFKAGFEIVVTIAALCIVYPAGAPYAVAAFLVAFFLPYVALRLRRRGELRVQTHAAALAQVQLDSLLGLLPLRTHGGQRAARAKQQEHLTSWHSASERGVAIIARCEAAQSVGIIVAITALVLSFLTSARDDATLLLVAFWALRLPLHARSLSAAIHRVPELWASTTRLVDPLTATESADHAPANEEVGERTLVLSNRHGMRVSLDRVSVVLGSERVLDALSIDIQPGQHVAVVGSSGAGKSSLVATILGVLDPSEGSVSIDGVSRDVFGTARLRRETVWVDPSVQLWNRSLAANVEFGNPEAERASLHDAMGAVDLGSLLEKLPRGFATDLGESGVRVSGGEGQRVRLARGVLRRGARLFLLDEAFRGLDRNTRRGLSRTVRERVGRATVIEVTHDVADTLDFDHVLVVEDGKLVEQGSPATLMDDPSSRYASLVRDDIAVQRDVWNAEHWKRLVVGGDGRVRTWEIAS